MIVSVVSASALAAGPWHIVRPLDDEACAAIVARLRREYGVDIAVAWTAAQRCRWTGEKTVRGRPLVRGVAADCGTLNRRELRAWLRGYEAGCRALRAGP